MKRSLLLVIAALAAASLACSININLPDLPRLKTGPTETLEISEPLPDAEVVDVSLRMGAGNFKLSPGAEGLVDGVIQYNVAEWKPTVTNEEGKFTIEQGSSKDAVGLPDGNSVVNDWELKLGDIPLNLTINAGAYKGTVDLTGLRLRRLDISDGASDSEVTFDSVNPEEMEKLTYNTGASKVRLSGLANANFAEMSFTGGAGDYTLDFSGELQRDATVTVETGISNVRLIIPSGTAAKVTVTSGLGNVRTQGAWTQTGDTYTTSGAGPELTIEVKMGVGDLTLVNK